MPQPNTRPKWWQIYLLLPLLIGLFLIDFRLNLSDRGHQVLQIGILLFVYWLAHLWMKANQITYEKKGNTKSSVIITLVPTSRLNGEKLQPLFHPNSEVAGIFDDTFQIDIIEAEILSTEEIPQEANKEIK